MCIDNGPPTQAHTVPTMYAMSNVQFSFNELANSLYTVICIQNKTLSLGIDSVYKLRPNQMYVLCSSRASCKYKNTTISCRIFEHTYSNTRSIFMHSGVNHAITVRDCLHASLTLHKLAITPQTVDSCYLGDSAMCHRLLAYKMHMYPRQTRSARRSECMCNYIKTAVYIMQVIQNCETILKL